MWPRIISCRWHNIFCLDADMSHLMFWAPGDGLSTAFRQISIPVQDMSSLSYDQATAPLTVLETDEQTMSFQMIGLVNASSLLML